MFRGFPQPCEGSIWIRISIKFHSRHYTNKGEKAFVKQCTLHSFAKYCDIDALRTETMLITRTETKIIHEKLQDAIPKIPSNKISNLFRINTLKYN